MRGRNVGVEMFPKSEILGERVMEVMERDGLNGRTGLVLLGNF
jgi:hypothetical protein